MKKKYMSLILVATFVLISFNIATAATRDTSGFPNWYTPYDGQVSIGPTYVEGRNLKWSQWRIDYYDSNDYWELEFRPRTGEPDDVWDGVDSLYSNLPGAYEEYDEDDVTVGTYSPDKLVSGTSYYGMVYMDWNSNSTDPFFIVESEKGLWLGVDGWPERYEYITTYLSKGSSTYW